MASPSSILTPAEIGSAGLIGKTVLAFLLFLIWERGMASWLSESFPWVGTKQRPPRRHRFLRAALALVGVVSAALLMKRVPLSAEGIFLWASVLPLLNLTVPAPPNFLLGRPQHAERWAMLTLGLLAGWQPAATAILLAVFPCFVPGLSGILGRSFTDVSMPLACLIAYCSAGAVDGLVGGASVAGVWFPVAIATAFYVVPGIGKWRAGWIRSNHPGALPLAAAFQWDWPLGAGLARRWFAASAVHVSGVNRAVVVGEIAIIGATLGSGGTLVAALAALLFHVSVAGVAGILFWEWSVVWVGLAGWAWVMPDWSWTEAGVALLVAVGYARWGRLPDRLTWFDSTLVHRFDLVARMASGRSLRLPPSSLAPFETIFSQGRFHFLRQEPALQGCLGTVASAEALTALNHADSVGEIEQVKTQLGQVRWDETKTKAFLHLLQAWLRAQPSSPGSGWSRLPRIDRLPTGWPPVESHQAVAVEIVYHEIFFSVSKSKFLYKERELLAAVSL